MKRSLFSDSSRCSELKGKESLCDALLVSLLVQKAKRSA